MKHIAKPLLAFLITTLLFGSFMAFVPAASNSTADSATATTLLIRWEEWKHKSTRTCSEDLRFDRAFRSLYADDPDVIIQNHVVYVKAEENTKAVWQLVDFFDTNEAEQSATKLVLPGEIQGLPVRISMFFQIQDSRWPCDGGYQNNTVKKLVLSGRWTEIQPFSFSSFSALQDITLPESVAMIGEGAFQKCIHLKAVRGARDLTAVDKNAFIHCKALASFSAISGVTQFADAAFLDTGFSRLTLSGDARFVSRLATEGIGLRPFAACKKLKTVTFSEPTNEQTTLVLTTKQFKGCISLKKVTLPTRCKAVVLGPMAFRDCTALKAVEKTAKIVAIHRGVFRDCSALRTLSLGQALQFIKWDALLGCNNLKKLSLRSESAKIFRAHEDMLPFSGYPGNENNCNFVKRLPETCTIYVSNESMRKAVIRRGFKGEVRIANTIPI